jgi:hypothetical protein
VGCPGCLEDDALLFGGETAIAEARQGCFDDPRLEQDAGGGAIGIDTADHPQDLRSYSNLFFGIVILLFRPPFLNSPGSENAGKVNHCHQLLRWAGNLPHSTSHDRLARNCLIAVYPAAAFVRWTQWGWSE